MLTLGLVWLVAAAPAARADGQVTVNLSRPAEGSTLSSAPAVQGDYSVQGDNDHLAGVDTVQLTVAATGGQPASASTTPCGQGACGTSGTFSWTADVAYNGPYRVEVRVDWHEVTASQEQSTTLSHRFDLAVPPAAPTGVKAAYDASAHAVNVTWTRNREPDMLFYVVQREDPGSSQSSDIGRADQPPSSASTVGFRDTSLPGGGRYAYQIVAVRKGADPNDPQSGVSSSRSAPAGATVDGPPAPGGSGDGTGGAGSGSVSGTAGSGGSAPVISGAGAVDPSKFASLQSSPLALPAPKVTPPPQLQLPDGTFDPTLPFTTTTTDGELGADDAQVAAPGGHLGAARTNGQRALLVSVAAGAIVLMLAFHLRWLTRRVAAPDLGG